MKRTIEDLRDGRYKITEATNEIHYTEIERPFPEEGYRLFQYIAYPILTQEQIDSTDLPYFDVDKYETYPNEGDQLFAFLHYSHNLYGRSILERVARIKISQNLNLNSTAEVI